MSLRDRAMRSVHAQREGFTMILYMSIITLAVLVADGPPGKARDDVALIVGTAVGTLAAHLLAFRLAASYFESAGPSPAAPVAGGSQQATVAPEATGANHGTGHAEDSGASVYALVTATLIVVVVASLPYFIFALETANAVSTGLLSLIIGASAWAVAQAGGRTGGQSLVYAVVVTAIALAIAVLKDILVH